MTPTHSHGRISTINARTAGWAASVCVHGAVALGAAFFLQHLQLASELEPFQWNIAMVEPVASPDAQATANRTPPVPPEPARTATTTPLQQTSPPAPPAPTDRPVEPSRVEAAPRPLLAPIVPAPPPPAPVQAAQPPRPEPAPQPPQQPSAPEKMEPAPEPVREPLPAPSKAIAKSEEATQPAPAIEPSPDAWPSRQTSDPSPSPSESRLASTQPATDVPPQPIAAPAPPLQSAPPSDQATRQDTPAAQPAPSPQKQDIAALAPPVQSKAAKPDDGWLADLMGKWIQDLEKHYPASLRTEGVQGKVVIVAMLHDDGTLTDVRVAKSSGHPMLDQAAVSDVEKGPPIHLARPLGRPQRPIKFSISYDLKTGR